MSGIYGYFNCDSDSKICLKYIEKWNTPYGRDKRDSIENEDIGMGCCYERLTSNPIPDNCVIPDENNYFVIDSIIYNRDDLLLKYNKLLMLSDEELLVSMIINYGLESLKDVNGDFSGAIYNKSENSLILFRDHMGIRPLYYYCDSNNVIFSTDIRGILALPSIDTSINERWFYNTMNADINITSDETEYKYIKCVPPAGYIKFWIDKDKINCETKKYWKLSQHKIRFKTKKQYCEGLRELITDSISRRANSVNVSLGAELSGGLDSGVIDIILSRLGKQATFYSWSYSPDEVPFAKQDERLIIEDICKQENISCNYKQRRMMFDINTTYANELKKIGIDFKDEDPGILELALPPYMNTVDVCLTSQFLAKNGARIVFTGHGGDEGVSHRSNPYELLYYHEYYHYLRYMYSTTHGNKMRIKNTLKKIHYNINHTSKIFKEEHKEPFSARILVNKEYLEKNEGKFPRVPFYFPYDPVSYVKNGGSRNRLDVVALFGAFNNVRYMMPYLDYRVIDYALSIPRHMFLKPVNNRYIFREAFKDIMPESLYKVQTKCDNSFDNIPKSKVDWFEIHQRDKVDTVAHLDREYWKDYLDFEVIDQWVNSERPSEEERDASEANVVCLIKCALASSVITQARSVNYN